MLTKQISRRSLQYTNILAQYYIAQHSVVPYCAEHNIAQVFISFFLMHLD